MCRNFFGQAETHPSNNKISAVQEHCPPEIRSPFTAVFRQCSRIAEIIPLLREPPSQFPEERQTQQT
jgi:hypothetical protein